LFSSGIHLSVQGGFGRGTVLAICLHAHAMNLGQGVAELVGLMGWYFSFDALICSVV
jgi:hypothetical protein